MKNAGRRASAGIAQARNAQTAQLRQGPADRKGTDLAEVTKKLGFFR